MEITDIKIITTKEHMLDDALELVRYILQKKAGKPLTDKELLKAIKQHMKEAGE